MRCRVGYALCLPLLLAPKYATLEDDENDLCADTKTEQHPTEKSLPPPKVEPKPEISVPTQSKTSPMEETPQVADTLAPVEEVKPKVRHSWYQTDSFVCITFFIRDRTERDITVNFGDKTVRDLLPMSSGLY